jgi:hypothetical protein
MKEFELFAISDSLTYIEAIDAVRQVLQSLTKAVVNVEPLDRAELASSIEFMQKLYDGLKFSEYDNDFTPRAPQPGDNIA